jgi:TetR/AcrR family transcriptional regulator, mexJK operon transcriptional repressor
MVVSTPAPTSPPASRADRYLDAALALFAEHGYVGTTMDMLVAQVGGSKATLYRYFPTKESLVTGLMDRVAATVNPIADHAASTLPLDEELTRMGTAALRGVTSPQGVAVLRICLGEYGRFPELARVVWEHGPAVTYANFRAFLEDRQRRGELTVEDPQLAAEHFLAGIVGHIQLKVAFGITGPLDDAEIDRRVRSATTTFLARYATVPPAAPAD